MKLLYAISAVVSANNFTDVTDMGRNGGYAPEEPVGCGENEIENSLGECVLNNPCQYPHTCAYEADCVAGENSWDYTCTCDTYGDGNNFCKDPVGCEPNADDFASCGCYDLDDYNVNITATWNDTDTCYYEINLYPESQQVGSWKIDMEFDQRVAMLDVWRAISEQTSATEITLRPQFYNLNNVDWLNFHITTENTQVGCPLYAEPGVSVCTSEYVESTTALTPIDEIVDNVEECVDMDVRMDSDWEGVGEYKQTMSLSANISPNIKEWYIQLTFNDDALFDRLEAWTANFDAGTKRLSSVDYNKILYSGYHTFGMKICSFDAGLETTAQICYQKYE
jgi:hypothetical protein